MSHLTEQWKKESEELVEQAKQSVKEPSCLVDFKVDSVGAISAIAYGENGIEQVDLCFNDDTSKRKGTYMLRSVTPSLKDLYQAYSTHTGNSMKDLKPNNEEFISWLREILKKDPSERKELSEVHWSAWKLETYDTKLEALSALLSGKAFNLSAKAQEQEAQPQ